MSVKEFAVISIPPQGISKPTDRLGQAAPLELHMANLPLTPYSAKGVGSSMLAGRGTPEPCGRSNGSGACRLGDLRLLGVNNDHNLKKKRRIGTDKGHTRKVF